MLNPYERMVYHIVGWFILIVSLAYFSVFGNGFQEGFQQATATAAAAATACAASATSTTCSIVR